MLNCHSVRFIIQISMCHTHVNTGNLTCLFMFIGSGGDPTHDKWCHISVSLEILGLLGLLSYIHLDSCDAAFWEAWSLCCRGAYLWEKEAGRGFIIVALCCCSILHIEVHKSGRGAGRALVFMPFGDSAMRFGFRNKRRGGTCYHYT